jgi:opacity protein-like surface antigen
MQLRDLPHRLAPLAFALLLWTAAPAHAQQEEEVYGPRASEFLTSFNMSYNHADVDGFEFEDFAARVGLGYVLTRHHELGLDLASVYQATEGGGSDYLYFLGPVYNYNFYATPRTSFYAGGRLGLEYVDVSDAPSQSNFSYGLQVGMRQWLTPRVSFNVEPRFTRTNLDVEGLDRRDEFGIFLGFNVVL